MGVLPRAIAAAVLAGPAAAAPFDQMTLIHTHPMGGVYTQDWFAQPLGQRHGPAIDIYGVGDGKAGDFFGVLAIDCATPARSAWIATGGVVPPESVPPATVNGLRALACDS